MLAEQGVTCHRKDGPARPARLGLVSAGHRFSKRTALGAVGCRGGGHRKLFYGTESRSHRVRGVTEVLVCSYLLRGEQLAGSQMRGEMHPTQLATERGYSIGLLLEFRLGPPFGEQLIELRFGAQHFFTTRKSLRLHLREEFLHGCLLLRGELEFRFQLEH